MRCTFRRYIHAHIHGKQERPHTQYKHRTRWSRSTRTTSPGGNRQRRARRHQQQPKGGNNARPTPMVSATPEAGCRHQAHPPHAPPTRYTASTRSQRPKATRTMTPAPPTQPGPYGGEMIGEGATRRQMEPEPDQTPSQHTDIAATTQTEPQVPQHASVPRARTARSIAITRTTAT